MDGEAMGAEALGEKKAKVKCEMLNLGQVTLACAIVSTSQTATLQQHYDNSLQHPLCAPSVWTFGLCCLHPCVHKFLFILFLFLPLLTLVFQAPRAPLCLRQHPQPLHVLTAL